jgi:hypothetical protein
VRLNYGAKYISSSFADILLRELPNLYASTNMIWVIKSWRMRWAGHVSRMEEVRNTYEIFVEKLEGKNHSDDLGVDGRIILEWILGWDVEWMHLAQDRNQWLAVVNTIMNLRVP